MTDYQSYKNAYDDAARLFLAQISDRETKAFEYGVIVVRNAVLVSGGGLLAIPTIIGLSNDLPVDRQIASLAGLYFAMALFLCIATAYIIHINWTLHVAAWERDWADRQILLKKVYLDKTPIEKLPTEPAKHYSRAIKFTFCLPHICALAYLVLIARGFFLLYKAFVL
jgi:hypothetical protein